MLHLALSVQRVGRNNNRSGQQRSIKRNRILRDIEKRNGDAIPFFHTQALECVGKAMRVVSELSIAQHCPVVDERGAVWIAAGCAIKQPGQGLIWNIYLSRDSLLIMLYPRMGHDERFIPLSRLFRDVWFHASVVVD